jgi:uncharacterized protein (TIGR02596 family)
MMPAFARSRCRSEGEQSFFAAAFTLIELIVVLAIIGILAVLIVPAFNSINRASNLTNSAALIVDQLTRARQEALSQNRVVEVRFYKLPGEVGSPPAYRAFRIFVYDESVQFAAPLTAVLTLSPGVIVMDDQTFSTLLNTDSNKRTLNPATDTIPGRNDPVSYQAFRFRPSGGTDLDPNGAPGPDKWFLTVKSEIDVQDGSFPAHNYVTATLDPVSGRMRIFRP